MTGDLRLNPATREALRGERDLELTGREFELLEHLMRNERLVVTREKLLEEVWDYAPLRRDQHHRRVRVQPAPQARGRRRAARAAHRARLGLRAEAHVSPQSRARSAIERTRLRLPIRLKLAVVSAGLTFVILALFALVVGGFTEQRLTTSFDDDLRATTADLQERFRVQP